MKISTLVLMSAMMIAASQVRAQDEPEKKGGDRRQEMIEKLKAADKDGDGKISKEEAPDRLKENFDKVDANGDGFVDRDEMREAFQAFARQAAMASIMKTLKEADKDGDEKLSKEEAPQQLKDHFEKVDANGDGFVDQEEVKQALAQLAKMREGFQERIARLKEADKNGDGKLSKDEAPDRLKEHFDDIDANDDGFVDQEELRKAFGEMMRRRGEKAESESESKESK